MYAGDNEHGLDTEKEINNLQWLMMIMTPSCYENVIIVLFLFCSIDLSNNRLVRSGVHYSLTDRQRKWIESRTLSLSLRSGLCTRDALWWLTECQLVWTTTEVQSKYLHWADRGRTNTCSLPNGTGMFIQGQTWTSPPAAASACMRAHKSPLN